MRDEAAAHRQRSKQMNEARAQLQAAFADCLPSKTEPGKHSTLALSAARRRMAAICETLGWLRAAQAWSRLGNDL